MLSDPLTFTLNGVAKSLARISVGDRAATYATADGLLTLEITHQTTGKARERFTVRLTQKKVVTDPLTAVNDYDSTTVTRTFDRPGFGFSDVELGYLETGLSGLLTSGTITKLYGGEA